MPPGETHPCVGIQTSTREETSAAEAAGWVYLDNAAMRTDPEAPQGRAGYLTWHTQLAGEPLPSTSLQTTSALSSTRQEGAVLHARPQHLHPVLVSSIPLAGHGSRAQC